MKSASTWIGGLALAVVLGGCASTAPKPEYQGVASSVKIDANDPTTVTVEPAPDVTMLDLEKQRLAQVVQQKIDLARAKNPDSAETKTYTVELLITRYAKGNAFARSMLAGLGQIHIDATVTVYEGATRNRVSEFKIDKTFAWGGMYGGFTSIVEVEPAFAEGIAAAVTGQE